MGVLVLRGIAASHLPARHAHPKVHPRVADGDALCAPGGCARNVAYLVKVRAGILSTAQPLKGEPNVGTNAHDAPPATNCATPAAPAQCVK
jgi:hypothetical protein